jgi:hypothetical protein
MEEIGKFGSESSAVSWCNERDLSPYDYQIEHIGDEGVKLWVNRDALNGEARQYGQFLDR